jgi:hypothetical protein
LLRVILGDPERLEFLREEYITKSSRVGGESITVACFYSLFATNLVNPMVGIVAAT